MHGDMQLVTAADETWQIDSNLLLVKIVIHGDVHLSVPCDFIHSTSAVER